MKRHLLFLLIVVLGLFGHLYGDTGTLNAGGYVEVGPVCVGYEWRGTPGFFDCEGE